MTRKEFENSVPQLRPLIVKVGLDFFGNTDDAEDVAQDVLVRLWQYCEQLDASRNLAALAITVAKNICIEHYRRRQMTVVQPPDDTPAGNTYSADAGIESKEAQERIDTAIKHLAPREQQLVRKRYIEDQTADEIAQETGIPRPSVSSMISTARAKLIKILRSQ